MIKNWFLSLKNFKKTKATKRLTLVIFVLSILSLTVLTPLSVNAGLGDAMTNVVAWLLDLIMSLIGALISLVLSVLINIAQFNEFTSATAVTTGWVLVRDICNMFFIVILLVISVGTVLGIQSYSYKNFLKKIIMMAILINFSKTIAGFLIDLSQIIMLTFVAAFRDSIIVGFTEAFGINKLKSLASSMDASGEIERDNFSLLLGMIFGLIISFILLMALIAIISMLAYRIVILWILVVLSPFAYLASALPGSLGGQAKQWWSMFSEQLIVGPAIAFFLWLTLSIVSATGGNFTSESGGVEAESIIGGQLATAPFLLNYFLGITLLLVGMDMAKKMGGKSGAAMGKAFEGAKKYGWRSAKSVGRGTRNSLSWGKDVVQDKIAGGRDLRVKKLEEKAKKGNVWSAMKLDKLNARDKSRKESQGKIGKKFGLGEKSFEAIDVIANRGLNKAQADAKADARTTALAELAANPGELDNLQKAERAEQIAKAEESAKKKAEKDWEGFSEEKKNSSDYGGDRNKYIEELKNEAIAKVPADLNSFTKAAENKYVAKKGKEAADQAKVDYQKRSLSIFNPLKPMLNYAADQNKFKKDAEQSREALASSPAGLTENRFIDKEGKAKEGSIKTILGQMSEPEIKNLVDHWTQEEANGTKDADKVLGNLLTGLKVASEKGFSPAATAVYNSLPTGLRIQRLGKSEELSSVAPGKSKEFLTDIDEKKVLNTATEIENEVNYLGDIKVRAGEDDDGWEVDREKSIEGKVALKKEGEESKEIDRDVFMKHNGSLLADHFYNSDRYERLKADKGEDSLLSREDYNTHVRIKDSSQEGVSLGSFGQGSDWTAVDYVRFNEVTGNLVGDSKAGVTVQGDDAIKAAEGMEIMIDDQVYELENAKTDDEVKDALSKFGYNDIKDGADLDEMKQKAFKDAEMAKERLKDKDKIAEEGLIIINKQRGAREIRSTLRHERAHKLIESVDKDGAMQNEVWDRMSPEEQEEAREYIRKDRNQPDMDEAEIRTEYIADAFANTRKPGGAKEGAPKLPPALADRLEKAEALKIKQEDVGVAGIKETYLSSRIKAYKVKKQRRAEKLLQDTKDKAVKEWDENKEANLAAMKKKTGNDKLTEEEGMKMFVSDRAEKAEAKAKTSLQKKADSHKVKTSARKKKLDEKKAQKEKVYSSKENQINIVRQEFAERFNSGIEEQKKYNSEAHQLEVEAETALNKEGGENEYKDKMDKARALRKKSALVARRNSNDERDYGKRLNSLTQKADKAKKKTKIVTPENDPNVWNDAMSGTGKLGKIVYSAGGRQLGVKTVADLALHGLAKVGIAKGLAAKTSDTYKYEMQKRQVNMEKGQFAELFTDLDSVAHEAMRNGGSAKDSQEVVSKKDELMKRIDQSQSMSPEDKAKFKERIGGIVDNMMDAKGGVDVQRFTKANELMNAFMKTKVSGASIAKDALNGALVMSTGGLGAGVASARMGVFAGTALMNKVGESKANYIKEGKTGSQLGNLLKDITVGNFQESYKSISDAQGFKGKALGVAGAVGKLSTAYAVSAGLTDSDEFIEAFTQPTTEPAGNLFDKVGDNLATNAKAVGERYAGMPERLSSLVSGPEPIAEVHFGNNTNAEFTDKLFDAIQNPAKYTQPLQADNIANILQNRFFGSASLDHQMSLDNNQQAILDKIFELQKSDASGAKVELDKLVKTFTPDKISQMSRGMGDWPVAAQSKPIERLGSEFVSTDAKPEAVAKQIADNIDNVGAKQEAVFAEEIEKLASQKTELRLRGVSNEVEAGPIEYIPINRVDSLTNPSSEQLIDKGLPQDLAKKIDEQVGSTGASSVQFMEKLRSNGSGEKTVQWIDNNGQTQTEVYSRTEPQIKIDYGDPPPPSPMDYAKFAAMPQEVRAGTLTEVYSQQGMQGEISNKLAAEGWHSGNGKLEFTSTESGSNEVTWTANDGNVHKYEYNASGKVIVADAGAVQVAGVKSTGGAAQVETPAAPPRSEQVPKPKIETPQKPSTNESVGQADRGAIIEPATTVETPVQPIASQQSAPEAPVATGAISGSEDPVESVGSSEASKVAKDTSTAAAGATIEPAAQVETPVAPSKSGPVPKPKIETPQKPSTNESVGQADRGAIIEPAITVETPAQPIASQQSTPVATGAISGAEGSTESVGGSEASKVAKDASGAAAATADRTAEAMNESVMNSTDPDELPRSGTMTINSVKYDLSKAEDRQKLADFNKENNFTPGDIPDMLNF